MKTLLEGRSGKSAAPVFVAVLTVFLAVFPLTAQVEMKSLSGETDIDGGSGPSAWRLRYGSLFHLRVPHEFLNLGAEAYFSHGGWLRRLDTKRGVVTGRWHFPWQIGHLAPAGEKLSVEIVEARDLTHTYRQTIVFDPSHPNIPNWPGPGIDPFFPITEATAPWRLAIAGSHYAIGINIAPEQAREVLPRIEDMVQHDPLSPWFRIVQGVLLKTIGDPRATAAFHEAVAIPGLDYSELLRMSAFLSQMEDEADAAESFERGYRDFLDRGFEPRMFLAIWQRRAFFPAVKDNMEWMERSYRLAPYPPDSSQAWQAVSGRLMTKGDTAKAGLWKSRASDPGSSDRQAPLFVVETTVALCFAVFFAAMLTAILYFAILDLRYQPQRAVDRREGQGWLSKPFATLFHLEYSNRYERAVLLVAVYCMFFAAGLMVQLLAGFDRMNSDELWRGSLAGPSNVAYLESQPAQSSERDLLLAMAYQQNGEDAKAESLYRRLPDFPEAWNNLGVLLKKQGKEQEARAAFAEALRIDPDFAEAALNSSGAAKDFWTQQYSRMFPGRPMLAPARGKHFSVLYFGGSRARMALRALAGPQPVELVNFPDLPGKLKPAAMRKSLLVALALLIALLLVFPQLKAPMPPRGFSYLVEALLPGSAPRWLWFAGLPSGLVMMAWWLLLGASIIGMVAGRFLFNNGPRLIFSYGIEGGGLTGLHTAWLSAIFLTVLLFAANGLLVWRSWQRAR